LVERNTRAQQYLVALETLAERAEAGGEHTKAIRLLRRAEALDPLCDSVARRLMACLAATGDPAAAIEVYRNFRTRLHEELAAAPDEPTTRLFHEIRARSREHSGVQAPNTRTSFDKLRAGSEHPNTSFTPSPVPRPLTPLIGREQEVSEVHRLLQENRLVT